MMLRSAFRRFLLGLACLALLSTGLALAASGPFPVATGFATAATAVNAGCSTLYLVSNIGFGEALYVHEFKDGSGTLVYSFSDSLGPNTSKTYDTRTLASLPDGFSGSLIVSSDQPLSTTVADVVGCDGEKYAASLTSSVTVLEAGQRAEVQVAASNDSAVFPWSATGSSPVHVGYRWYQGTTPIGSWDDGQRGFLPRDVPPGDSVTVTVPVQVPANPGSYTLWFDVVQEGVTWFSAQQVGPFAFDVVVAAPFANLSWISSNTPGSMAPGQELDVVVAVKNTSSSFVWQAGGNNPIHVSSHWSQSGTVVVWDGERGRLPADVAPGQTVTVTVPVRAPSAPGNYTISFDLVQEGITWFSAFNAPVLNVNVALTSPYARVEWNSVDVPGTIEPGQSIAVPVTLRNSSSGFTWSAGGSKPVHVATHWYQDGKLVTWDGDRGVLPGDVPPGTTITLDVPVNAPSVPGTYTVWFDVVEEGVTWFSSHNAPTWGANVTVVSPYASIHWAGSDLPSVLSAGQTIDVPITIHNTSASFTWNAAGDNPIRVATHWYRESTVILWDGARAALPYDVLPGGKATVKVPVTAPVAPGKYAIWFDVVQEGLTWFSAQGAPTLGVEVVVP